MKIHPVQIEQLIAYAAGELEPIEYPSIAVHIANCAECTRTVKNLRTIRATLETDDTVTPPPAILARAYAVFAPPASHTVPKFRHRSQGWFNFQLGPRFALSAAVLVLAMLFLTSSVVGFARSAIPGDTLYPVKTASEQVQLGLAVDASAKTLVRLDLARHRLDELSALTEAGRYLELANVAQAFAGQVQAAASTLDELDSKGGTNTVALAQHVNNALDQYTGVLYDLSQASPPQARPALDRAMQVSRAEQQTVQQRFNSAPSPAAPAAMPPRVPTPVLLTATPHIVAPVMQPTPLAPAATPIAQPTGTNPAPAPAPLPTPAPVAPASTPQATTVPSVPPSATAIPPTATALPPSATAVPPTETAAGPTATNILQATATAQTATNTQPATATPVPGTSTLAAPAATQPAPIASEVPPTSAPQAPTATSSAATVAAATATPVPATPAPVPPTLIAPTLMPPTPAPATLAPATLAPAPTLAPPPTAPPQPTQATPLPASLSRSPEASPTATAAR